MKNLLQFVMLLTISICCLLGTTLYGQQSLIESKPIILNDSNQDSYLSLSSEFISSSTNPLSSTCEPGNVNNNNNDPWSEECYLNNNCDLQGNPCQANDVNLLGAFLADIDGNPIETCAFNEPTTVYLWGGFINGTNSDRYAVRTRTEVWINEAFYTELNSCSFDLLAPGQSNQALIGEFTFTCGDIVEFRSTWVGWETSASQCTNPSGSNYQSTCGQYGPSKCSKDMIPIRLLSPNFTYNCAEFTETTTQVCFQDLTTGGDLPYNYLWNFGNGDYSNQQNPCYTFNATSGIYNVILQVTDAEGVVASATLPVDLDNLFCPNPGLTLSKSAEIDQCAEEGDMVGYTILLENTGNQRISNIVVSDPMITLTSNLFSLEPGEQITFTGNYQLTNADILSGELSNTATATGITPAFVILEETATSTVELFNLPTATAAIEHVTCFNGSNGSISLTMTGGSAPYSYSWSHDATINSPEVTDLEAGDYSLTISDANGCITYYEFSLDQPTIGLDIVIIPQDEICAGANDGSVNIEISGGTAPYSVVIKDNEGNVIPLDDIQDLQFNTHTAKERTTSYNRLSVENTSKTTVSVSASRLAPGTYNIIVTDDKDCEHHDDFKIEPGLTVGVNISGTEGPVCPGTESIFTGPENMDTYHWSITGNGTISGNYDQQSVSVIAGSTCEETYSISLTVTHNTCEASTDKTIMVDATEDLVVNAPAPVDLSACTATDIQAAYNAWVEGFNFTGDCNATDNIAEIPALPADAYCNGADLSFTYTVTGDCNADNKTSTFKVTPSPALEVNAPVAVDLSACTTTDIHAAYNAWVDGFNFTGDCNATDNIAEIPALPADAYCNGADLNFTFTVTGDCGSDSKTSTFKVAGAPAVELTVPGDYTGTTCMTQADVDADYANFISGANFTGGCGAELSNNAPAQAPSFCGGSVTVDWTVTSNCEEIVVKSATFTIPGAPAVEVNKPDNFSEVATEYDNQQAIDEAFVSWLSGFTATGGCDPQGDYGIVSAPSICGGTTSVTYTVTDVCIEPIEVTATFTIISPNPLVISKPEDAQHSACAFDDQNELDAEFAAWLNGFSVSGGFNPEETIEGTPVAPILCEGGSVTVTYNVTDECGQGSVSATFTINAPDAVAVAGPADFENSACQFETQADLDTEFAAWIAQFIVTEAGCGVTTPDLSAFEAPVLCEGGEVSITFTVSDLCSNASITSTFNVIAPEQVALAGPTDFENSACQFETQADLDTEFTAWIAQFIVAEAGCGVTAPDLSAFEAPELCEGGEVSVTFAIEDLCTDTSITRTFKINAPADLAVNNPAPVSADATAFADQAAIDAAFDTWIAGFSVSGGCSAMLPDLTGYNAPDICTGGVVTINYTIEDLCETDNISSSFTIVAPDAIQVTIPDAVVESSCDFADQAELNAAFEAWIDEFSIEGGYDAQLPDLSGYEAPALCQGGTVTVEFTVEDLCGESEAASTFTINAPAAVALAGPADFEASACEFDNQDDLNAEFTAWMGQFEVDGGCTTELPDLSGYEAPDYFMGGSVTVEFTIEDLCVTESISRTFTLIPAPGAPISGGDQEECEAFPVQTLTATATAPAGSTIVWYDAEGQMVAEPTLTSVGTVTYYAASVDENQCESFELTPVTLTILEAPILTCPADITIGVMAAPIYLTGATPEGGVYSGAGVTDGMFDPMAAGVGEHVITYTFVDEEGCEASCSYLINVISMPDFSCIPDMEVCNDDEAFELQQPAYEGGVYSGEGVTDGIFDPMSVDSGEYMITYTLTDEFGYVYSCNFFIVVNPASEVTLAAFEPVCNNTVFTLAGGMPEDGIYYIEGVEAVDFDASLLGVGEYEITYTFENEFECSGTATQTIEVLQAPCFEIIAEDISCFGAEDGFIKVIVDSECGPVVDICLEYENEDLDKCMTDKFLGQAQYEGLIAGTYYVVVTGANGCVTVQEVIIGQPAELIATAIAEETIICHDATTLVTVSATGGNGDYEGIGEFVVGVGTHDFIVTDPKGCTDLVSITIESFPVVEVTCREDIYIGEFAHAIVLEGSAPEGGVYAGPGVSYDAENEQYLFAAGEAGVGIHTIIYTVEDENGCFYTCEFVIEVYEMPDFSCLPDLAICADDMPLENLIPEGEEGVLSGTAIDNNVFYPETSGLGEFEITYTIADEFGYLYSCTFFIVVNEVPVATLEAFAPVCNNTVFALEGGMPEGGIYYIDGTESTVFDAELLGAGMFEITYIYTNEFDCAASAAQMIEVLPAPCFDIEVTHACYGEENGTIQVTVVADCGSVTDICLVYPEENIEDKCNSKFLGGATYTGLMPGVYQIMVTGTNGCITIEEVEVKELPLPVAEIAIEGALEFCEGEEVILTASEAVEYLWSNGETSQSITLNVSGEFYVTVTDENGCSNTSDIVEVIVNPTPEVAISASGDLEFCEGNEVILTATEAAAYMWSNGAETQSIIVDASGSFYIIITDDNGCTATSEVVEVIVNELPEAEILTWGDLEFCEGGSVELTATEAAEYLWSNGAETQSAIISETGEYYVTITDDNGCMATSETVEVLVNALPEVEILVWGDLEFCEGGTVELTATEAAEYLWSNDATTQSIIVDASGVYEVTITDANGCSNTSEPVEVTVFELPEVTFESLTVCHDAEPFALQASPEGGVFDGAGVAEGMFDAALAGIGIHEVIYSYTDSETGCTNHALATITVSEPITITAHVTDLETYGDGSGAISLTVTGGTAPYSYLWDNGELTATIENLQAGDYFVTVIDETGCVASKTITVGHNSILVDLGVTIEVNIQTPDPEEVDELIFALVVTNLDEQDDATGVVVENIIPQPFPFIARLDDGTSGTFNAATGTWAIGTIPAGEHVILVYKTEMLLTEEEKSNHFAMNTAQILPFDQIDPNLANNYAEIVVTVGESTGGDDNGIESNGSMAAQLALRNHRRLVENNSVVREERITKMESFSHTDMLTGSVKTASVDGNATGIAMLLPEEGPANTKAFVSTPADLLGITNAREIFSVDYLQQNNTRRAAILAISTSPTSVYEHTKVICDRLVGAELRNIEMIEIAGRPFILSQLVHPEGYVDYSVSFIAQRNGGEFVIDNRWYNEEYEILNADDIFNFQVWSVTPQFTRELVEEIIDMMELNGGVSFRNETITPAIPQVYVHSGRYTNGGLLLNLINKAGADQITIHGSKTLFENAQREPMNLTLNIPTEEFAEVFIPTGFLFDAGFSIRNNKDNAPDVLYYADGAWMFDYDPGNAEVTSFVTEAETIEAEQIDYKVERDASFSGRVRTWASMFRSLSPRNMPVDMTGFDQVVFTAHGKGVTEVMLAKAGIHQWSEQYRTTITMTEEPREYRINFSDLVTREGDKGFKAEDLVSVIFNPLGNGSAASSFDVNISNLHFSNSSYVVTPNAIFYPAYPNPFRHNTSIDLMVTRDSHVKIEIMNMYGQTVEILTNEEMSMGTYKFNWNAAGHKTGVYMIRITAGDNTYTTKVVFQK